MNKEVEHSEKVSTKLGTQHSVGERVRNAKLLAKLMSATDAVSVIESGMTIAVSTDARVISEALARVAKEKGDYSLTLWGQAPDLEIDGTLGKLGIIRRRVGQQTLLRREINEGKVAYVDLPMRRFYQFIRRNVLGDLDVAIVEASAITEEGNLIPAYSVIDMPNFAQAARKLIVKLQTLCPLEIEGIHDIYLPGNSYPGVPIPICKVNDRIGTNFIPLDTNKIAAIVVSNAPEVLPAQEPPDEISKKIAENLIAFLKEEVACGRLPESLAPIEIGLGRIPAAILIELYNSGFENLEFFSALLSDGVLDLIGTGKVKFATGTALLLSAQGRKKFISNIKEFKKFIILRPVEITDHPEVITRLGLIALNGAIELDIYGHANSTHIQGSEIINGMGGLGEFASAAYLSVVLLASTGGNGDLSRIVPMVSHVDLTEHMIDAVVTEQGYADLRGLTPEEKAERIIKHCSHPSYRPLLWDYFKRASQNVGKHEPQLLEEVFLFHHAYQNKDSQVARRSKSQR